MEQSFLIVGLGNIGQEYEKTRHNIGFRIVDQFAGHQAASFQKKRDLKGDICRFQSRTYQVTLLKPLTYMNLSGEALRKSIDFFKISKEKVLIIADDIDLPLGELRLRSSGSSGGHNGLKSIETHLGSKEYYRLKVGVGRNPDVPLIDFVLGRFTQDEEKLLPSVIDRAEELILAFVEGGYQGALNHLAKWRSQNTKKSSLESGIDDKSENFGEK